MKLKRAEIESLCEVIGNNPPVRIEKEPFTMRFIQHNNLIYRIDIQWTSPDGLPVVIIDGLQAYLKFPKPDARLGISVGRWLFTQVDHKIMEY